jgi:hypothetical protein
MYQIWFGRHMDRWSSDSLEARVSRAKQGRCININKTNLVYLFPVGIYVQQVERSINKSICNSLSSNGPNMASNTPQG